MVNVTPEHFNVYVLQNGNIIERTKDSMHFIEKLPTDIQSRLSYFNVN